MSDLNVKASEFIDTIELYYDIMLEKLHASELLVQQAHHEAHIALSEALEAQKSLKALQEAQLQEAQLQEETQKSIEESEKNITESIANVIKGIKDDVDDYVLQNTQILELQQKIITLEEKNQELEQKYQITYQSLQKEMVKVDTMQMELELLQRERDIALRKQSMSPEQKQLLVKLEYENYKINEAIERIDYISESLRKILGERVDDKTETPNLQKVKTEV
jgi:multidrug efflux pump subunit AcrA (membrane-fusion protein)